MSTSTEQRPSLKFYARASLLLAAVLLLPAIWSFFSAAWSAATTGQVLVISLGRTETAREMVPWTDGWARFAGPALLLGGIAAYAVSLPTSNRVLWWLSATFATCGLTLLMYSRWFTSLRGATALACFAIYLVFAAYVDRTFGRLAVTLMLLATVATLVYLYLGHG